MRENGLSLRHVLRREKSKSVRLVKKCMLKENAGKRKTKKEMMSDMWEKCK